MNTLAQRAYSHVPVVWCSLHTGQSEALRLGNRRASTLSPTQQPRRPCEEIEDESTHPVSAKRRDALMDWFRSFATDAQLPEMQALSHAAFRLWHDGRCYIAQTESDGFIPATQVSRFGPHGTTKNANSLVAAGLWETAPTGYIDRRWEDEQKSHAAMEASRKATAERVRRHRSGVGNGAGNAVTNGVGNTTRGREEQELEREVEVELHQTWPRAVNG